MGYLLLWLEAMASALLMVAVVFACSGRLKKWPALWPILMALLLGGLGIAATVFAGFLLYFNVRPQWLFPYTLLWTLLFISGSWILIKWGRQPTGAIPRAAHWSRSKLSGVLFIVLVFQWFTMTVLDNTARLEAIAAQTSALNKVQTLLQAPPAHDQNAAELYDQAAQELGDVPDWLKKETANPAFDPKSDKAQNLLREKKRALALFKEASQKPNYYQPLRLSFDFILEPITPLRNATRLLGLEARTYALSGQMAAALENISYMNKIAEHLEQTPHLINILIANAIRAKSKQALETILAEQPGKSKIKIHLPVKPHDHIAQAFHKSMIFEEAVQTFIIADILLHRPSTNILEHYALAPLEPNSLPTLFSFGILYRIFLYHDDVVSHKRYWEKIHKFTQKPYHKSGPEFKEWDTEPSDNPEFGLLTTIAFSEISNYFERVAHSQTHRLLTQLGLAAAAYHSDHGRYPKKLDALVPKYITEIPIDPFSGEPLKMKAMDNGMILYGVGPDLTDDQGAVFDSETDEGDIALYLGSAYTEYRLKPALENQRQ